MKKEIIKGWRGIKMTNGKRSASFNCPKCDGFISVTNHDISDNGEVNPSLVCPYDGCGFHEWVILENWKK